MRRRVAERVVTHADCALAVHLWELVTAHFQVGHVLAVTLKDDFQQHLVETTALSLWSITKCFEAEVCEVHVPKSGAIFFPQHFSVSCVALKAVGGFRKYTDDDRKERPKL